MSAEYAVETRDYTPKTVFAGEFPTLPETGTAAVAIPEWTPIVSTETGLAVADATTVANIIGISAAAAAAGDPVVYYMTGEFFADAINVPAGLTIATIKPVLRKISIFLR
jgi:hypothetical protein